MFRGVVFRVSLIIVLVLVVLGIFDPDLLNRISTISYSNIITHFGWSYLLAAFLFLIFSIVLAFSRYGNVKLGKDNEKPEYSYFGWFSMLFAAGMGIGLIFWGVAEPLNHYMNPPAHIAGKSGDAAAFAMRYSFFHWGLQPWAIYIIMSLSIAYFSFRRGMPPLISSCFYPLLGERIYGVYGYIIDILAVFATIFGVATSLGLGALQINSGLNIVFGLPGTTTTTLVLIAVVTVLFMVSSIVGLDKGIQFLSKSNMLIAGLLLMFTFIVGPTSYILNVFSSTLGEFANQFLNMSLQLHPFEGYEWTKSWTLFYWAWWIAWSPFVGLFVARISRGRTIKEFVLGALFVPTLLTFFWFSVFGGSAMELQLEQGINLAKVATTDTPTALFAMFAHYPLSNLLSVAAIFLLVVFFVTSADSATFVLGMMTSGGNMCPPLGKKVIWGIVQSTVAAILLLSGGLLALQKMAINAALPFTLIMVLMCYNLLRALNQEEKEMYPTSDVNVDAPEQSCCRR
ncbi:MAG: BCCT family transporter [Clostridiales bacterium]|nr:BCCT family transporter [Clostridiales bacterium]MCF8023420.1 BCCT family transporter [Clostridiales bacterium]